MRRCHIFAGGDLGSKVTKEYFRSRHGFVICADSGYKHVKKLGLRPDIIVGDFDSYKGKLPENAEIIRTVPEKDDTDTLMALKIAIERGYREIWLYGALGGERFDHSIANLQLMLYAREQGARLILCGNEWISLQGSDEVEVPVAGLVDKAYAQGLADKIDLKKSQTYGAGDPWPFESDSTTSYSILDAAGNMVAVTKTVDATFASALVAEGTGILLNDTLYDFSTDPDSPNVVAGNKRPLSSMSPTLVVKDGRPFLALGAPGSTRIISGVFQVITKVIDHGMDVQDAIDAVRMHDDFGTLILERRVGDEVIEALRAMGHEVNVSEVWFTFPCVQAVARLFYGTLRGAADPRRDGKAAAY